MRTLNPDTLQSATGEELIERQRRTGEVGDGKFVWCRPDPSDPDVIQQVSRARCLTTPYEACLTCPHHRFEYIFEVPQQEDWVLCPRWERGDTGPPTFYVPALLSECRAKLHSFCSKCPSREELVELRTDKKKQGWLERYRRLMKED